MVKGDVMTSDEFFITLWLWLFYAGSVFCLPFTTVAYVERYRVPWQSWDLLVFVLPFLIWAIAMKYDGAGKSLANLVEPLIFGIVNSLVVSLRLVMGDRKEQWFWSTDMLLLSCGVAMAIYGLMPSLPE